MIYNIYIFNRHCECVYFQTWHQGVAPVAPAGTTLQKPSFFNTSNHVRTTSSISQRSNVTVSETSSVPVDYLSNFKSDQSLSNIKTQAVNNDAAWEETSKLVYGVIYSLTNFCTRLSVKK
jgi:hypothetical protein